MKSSQVCRHCILSITLFLILLSVPSVAQAQMSTAEEIARKLGNPLADIHAILFENDVFFFDSGNGQKKGELYSFKLSPVWTIDVEDKGYSVIPRAVIPLNGCFQSANDHIGRIWGLGDITLQIFVAPKIHSSRSPSNFLK